MLVGAIVQLVTGAALIAVRRADDLAVIGAKMGVKGGIAVLVLGMVTWAVLQQRRLRKDGSSDAKLRPLVIGAGLAAVVNVVVAVFWS
jgi:hypothetical protein